MGKKGDVVRYILDRTIGRHKSQSDVHIPATCRRTVTTVIRAQQLRDFADPPYGFSMLTTSAARTPQLLWFARQLSKQTETYTLRGCGALDG